VPTKPEPTRFTQTVVADGLDEPLQLEVDDRGHVYWIERGGAIKRIHEATGRTDVLGTLPLYEGKAPGLIGVLLDDDFARTRQLYVYYSAAEDEGNMRLSRFTLGADDTIDMDSEVVVLRIPWEQPDGSHFGGGMVWDEQGNLYLSVGGDTRPSQYEPIHLLDDGRRLQNAARTAGNTNDLRGTILRITPQPDGSYTIPDGNLFSADTPDTRPEIYVMGTRNPWRLSIDSQTGLLHWGDVGPDAGANSETYGPMGYDEFNVARSAGNFGWPFVIGMNRPYHRYDYATKTYGPLYDPQSPINDAPNNTGLRELPPARPPLVAYPYKVSETWPILGSAARSAVGGPIFHRADFGDDAPRVFPPYFEDKWLVTDYARNWIMVVTMNSERTEATHIERLVPSDRLTHAQPLDMDFGPTGDLYLVEYGRGGQGQLSKIVYNDGNRPPRAQAGADRTAGATPLQLALSSEGTVDYDGDDLHYTWTVEPSDGGAPKQLTGANPAVTLEQPGRYDVVLTVRDPEGATDRTSFEVVAGNERPEIDIQITGGNRTFYFPDSTLTYEVQVRDREDGSLHGGGIPDERVHLTAEYLPSGLSPSQLTELVSTRGAASSQTPLRHLQAQNIIAQGTCLTCHRTDSALVGPSFQAVAERYADEDGAAETLSHSITEGNVGTWGETAMPPQTTLTETEVAKVVDYMLSLARPDTAQQSLPLQGPFTTERHEGEGGNAQLRRFFNPDFELGAYVFRAGYTDTGNDDIDGLALHADDRLLLRPPLLGPETADVFSEDGISYTPSANEPKFIVSGPNPHFGFNQIDLTGIRQINIGALTRFWHWSHFVGATVELRLDSPEGRLVGTPHRQFRPDSITAADGPFFGDDLDPPVTVDVSDVSGMHDLYVVFRNPEAGPDDALLLITGLEFKP
jgi:cytochrome c